MVDASGNVYCYHYNATGSTVAVTDETQTVVNKYAYDPFGTITGQDEQVEQPFKFVGQFGVIAEDNGLYYMRARYYDPEIGRFISQDPIGFAGGDVNLYGYVANNPINLVDPNGKLAFFWHFGITAVAAMNRGHSILGSLGLAWDVMMEDSNATATDAYSANTHAMRGEISPGQYQTRAQAIDATNFAIENDPLSSALHAGQDLPGHNGENMKDFGWNLDTVKHIWNDFFPGNSVIDQAYYNTRNTLQARGK